VRQTCCCTLVDGWEAAPAFVMNRPVAALRLTVVLLDVPLPTRSVVVLLGHRAAAAFETNLPVLALLLTDPPRRAIAPSGGRRGLTPL
jgi:hypothetical protein